MKVRYAWIVLKAEIAHAHCCKHTILYTKQDFVAEVSRISGGEKLPVVFDSVGKEPA